MPTTIPFSMGGPGSGARYTYGRGILHPDLIDLIHDVLAPHFPNLIC